MADRSLTTFVPSRDERAERLWQVLEWTRSRIATGDGPQDRGGGRAGDGGKVVEQDQHEGEKAAPLVLQEDESLPELPEELQQ